MCGDTGVLPPALPNPALPTLPTSPGLGSRYMTSRAELLLSLSLLLLLPPAPALPAAPAATPAALHCSPAGASLASDDPSPAPCASSSGGSKLPVAEPSCTCAGAGSDQACGVAGTVVARVESSNCSLSTASLCWVCDKAASLDSWNSLYDDSSSFTRLAKAAATASGPPDGCAAVPALACDGLGVGHAHSCCCSCASCAGAKEPTSGWKEWSSNRKSGAHSSGGEDSSTCVCNVATAYGRTMACVSRVVCILL